MNQPIGSMTGFPNNNNPKDKATYTFTVDVPETLEVVSNGEPQGTFPPMPSGGRATWVWKQTQPMASELVLVSIGQYIVRTGTVNLSGGRTVPEFSFLDATLNQTTFDARRAELSSVLTGLEAFLGPYPGKSTGIVVDVTGVGYALETQDRPTWPSTASVSGSFVHELTHQWYGDAVAPADWNGLWVNEGMATWAPEHLEGNNNENAFFGEWSTTGAGSSLWNLPPSGMTVPSQMFGWQSYDRGAMTYEALRAAIGDPAFFQLIKQWQTDFGGQTKKWTDLIALAQQISGRDLTAFFQDWIYDPTSRPGPASSAWSSAPRPARVRSSGSTRHLSADRHQHREGAAGRSRGLRGPLRRAGRRHHRSAARGARPGRHHPDVDGARPTPLSPSVATTSFPVTVRPNATQGSSLTATSTVSTLGGTCMTCSVTHTVGPQHEHLRRRVPGGHHGPGEGGPQAEGADEWVPGAHCRQQLPVVRGRQADQGSNQGDVQDQAVEARQADHRAGDGERTRVRRCASGSARRPGRCAEVASSLRRTILWIAEIAKTRRRPRLTTFARGAPAP